MSIFRFNLPFSMRTTDFFFGNSNDIAPSPAGSVNVFTSGLPQVTNSFSLVTEGESSVNLNGTFFTNSAGSRDGTIRSVFFGDFVEDDDGDATNIIAITGALSNLAADKSRFDDLVRYIPDHGQVDHQQGRDEEPVARDVHAATDAGIFIPMHGQARSMNVINASSMITGEALRQSSQSSAS